jgi:hypothetical protein
VHQSGYPQVVVLTSVTSISRLFVFPFTGMRVKHAHFQDALFIEDFMRLPHQEFHGLSRITDHGRAVAE